MKGQIVNIYQENIERWVGVSTGISNGRLEEFINLENGEKYFVDYENEVGELIVENIFITAIYAS